ncbi:hypothetical protein MRX96_050609 [Rhipicephalus microplus]
MPYQIARKVKYQIIRFFWNAKTVLVKYEHLGLPRGKGGWNIPSVVALAYTHALKTALKVLQLQEEHPTRKLATYFLGVQCRLFMHADANRGAEGDEPDDLLQACCEAKNPGFPWVLLTPSWLPGSIQDVVWRYGWSVLPTADRMYKWHYVRSEPCVHCVMYEDNERALLTCRVAKTFWSLVDRAYYPLGVERFVKRKRCPNGVLARLVLTAGMYVLWKNTGLAVRQAKARKNQWPLLVRLYNIVTDHLESEFFSLGEEEFLKRWSYAFIKIVNNRVVLA